MLLNCCSVGLLFCWFVVLLCMLSCCDDCVLRRCVVALLFCKFAVLLCCCRVAVLLQCCVCNAMLCCVLGCWLDGCCCVVVLP